MSKNHSRDDFFVDTGLLRDHVSKLRQQRKIASNLYANVLAMRNCSDPSVAYRYNPLLHDIELLIEYFDRMSRELSATADEAVIHSRQLGDMIEADTATTRHIVSNTLTL